MMLENEFASLDSGDDGEHHDVCFAGTSKVFAMLDTFSLACITGFTVLYI